MEEKSLDEPFLSRWSRRKLKAKEETAAAPLPEPQDALPAAAPVPAALGEAPEAVPGEGTEYQQFFNPRVDEKLRRTALRKLFSEPQFNVMDGLDTYIDDYSIPDPIPDAMLRQLHQAKGLFLFDDEKTTESADARGTVAPAATPEVQEAIAPPDAPAASAPGDTAAAARPPTAGSRND